MKNKELKNRENLNIETKLSADDLKKLYGGEQPGGGQYIWNGDADSALDNPQKTDQNIYLL